MASETLLASELLRLRAEKGVPKGTANAQNNTQVGGKIQGVGKPPPKLQTSKGKASILYELRQAEKISIETLLDKAENGLMTLISQNKRFAEYSQSIFSKKTLREDRESLLSDQLNHLNQTLSKFLRDVCPYLLQPAALNCIEYLIRKYSIHVYNVQEVLRTSLPFHRTSVFRSIITLLYVKGTQWSWVEGMQRHDFTVERRLFAKQCGKSPAFLDFILQTMKENMEEKKFCSVLNSFLYFTLSEFIETCDEMKEDLLVKLLSYCVFPGLTTSTAIEAQSAALLLVMQLSSKLTFSKGLIISLTEEICRGCRVELETNALQVLIGMLSLQKQLQEIPARAIKKLVRFKTLTKDLSNHTNKIQAAHFLKMLIPSLLGLCTQHQNYAATLLEVIKEADITQNLEFYVELFVKDIVHVLETSKESSNVKRLLKDCKYIQEIMIVLDAKFATQFDQILNVVLQKEAFKKHQSDISNVMMHIFQGTLRQPLENEVSTLQSGIDSPKASVRKKALEHLISLYEKSNGSVSKEFLHGALLRRIHDDDLSIVAFTFAQETLLDVNPQAILKEIQVIFEQTLACKVSKMQGKRVKAALKFLLMMFCKKHAGETDRAVALLLPFLLIQPHNRKLCYSALKLASKSHVGILKDIKSKKDILKEHKKKKKGSKSAISKDMQDLLVCQGIIKCIAEGLLEDENMFERLISSYENSILQHMLLMAVQAIVTNSKIQSNRKVQFLASVWIYIKKRWSLIKVAFEEKLPVESWENVPPSRDHISKLYSNSSEANTHLLKHLLFVLVDHLSPTDTNYMDILLHVFQLDPIHQFSSHISAALNKICNIKGVTYKVELILLETYYISQRSSDIAKAENIKLNVLKLLYDYVSNAHKTLSNLAGQQAVAKKRHRTGSKMNGDKSHLTGKLYDIDVEKCVVWLMTAACEGKKELCKASLDVLGLLSEVMKADVLKSYKGELTDKATLTALLHELGHHSSNIVSGEHTLNDVMKLIIQRADDNTFKDNFCKFLLKASTQYVNKHIAVNTLSLLPNLGSSMQRIECVELLLQKEFDKYIDSSYNFDPSQESKMMEVDVELLVNILDCFKVDEEVQVFTKWDWFDVFVASMHFPSIKDISWKVRRAAVNVVSNEFMSLLTVDRRSVIVHSLAYIASRDDNEIVQSLASEKLQSLTIDSKSIEKLLLSLLSESQNMCDPGHANRNKKKSKKDDQRSQNKFKWVQVKLEDKEALGLHSTIFALEILNARECGNLESIVKPLMEILEYLAYLHQASLVNASNEQSNHDVSDSKKSRFQSLSKSAIKVFQARELDASSNTIYGLQLGLETLNEIVTSSGPSIECLNLSLKCIQVVEHDSIHEIGLQLLSNTVNALKVDKLQSKALDIFHAIVDVFKNYKFGHGSNKSFFSNMLQVMMPFLSYDATRVSVVNKTILTIMQLSRSDQQLFLALTRQIWSGKEVFLLMLQQITELAIENSKRSAIHEIGILLCEQYDSEMCLSVYVSLLKESFGSGIDIQRETLLFIYSEMRSKRKSYKRIKEMKSELLHLVVDRIVLIPKDEEGKKVLNEEEKGLLEILHKLLELIGSMCETDEFIQYLLQICKSDSHAGQVMEYIMYHLKNYSGTLKKSLSTAITRSVSVSLAQHSDWTRQKALIMLAHSLEFSNNKDKNDEGISGVLEQTLEALSNASSIQFFMCAAIFIQSATKYNAPCITPLLPKLAKALISNFMSITDMGLKADSSNDNDSISLTLVSGLIAFRELVSKLPSMVASYLPDIYAALKKLLNLKDSFGKFSTVIEKAEEVLRTASTHMPVRVALPHLLELLRGCVDSDLNVTKAFIVALREMISSMDYTSVGIYHFEIVDVLLSCLDQRRKHSFERRDFLEYESAISDAMVMLVMKLSENSFHPLFMHMLDWTSKGSDDEADVVEVGMARKISLFYMVIKFTEKMRSIFVPYFKHLFQIYRTALEEEIGKTDNSKRKVRAKTNKAVEQMRASWILKLEVVHAFAKCFSYDTVDFTDESKLDELLPTLLSFMYTDIPADVKGTLNEYGREVLHMHLPSSPFDVVATQIISCLVNMAVAGNNDTIWKRFNYKVLLSTRCEQSRVKLMCIEVVSKLAQHLKEDYIVLIAETVPFIAELIEDKDQDVENACKEFVKSLEDIAGEDLKQYL